MNPLLKVSKAALYFVSFLCFTLVALRLTLDLNELKPNLEKFISLKTGTQCEIKGLELRGTLGLSLSSLELTFPLNSEQEKEWETFRTYLKARREAKEAGKAEPDPMKAPAPAPKLCLQNSRFDTGLGALLSVILGGRIEVSGESKLFACGEADQDLDSNENQYLSFSVATDWDGLSAPRRAQDLEFSYKLNEIDLGENSLLQASLPLSLKGKVLSQGQGHIVVGRLGRLQIKKSNASVKIEASDLETDATTINALELPAVSFGEVNARLKLDRGQLDLEEFKSQSEVIKGEFTGHLKLFGAWARTVLNIHIAMDLSAEFIRKNPDVKTIATLQRRYFTRRGDGGYDVGILLKGRVKKPRASAAKNSPYSKEGRSLNRSSRNAKQNKRSKQRRNRPKANPRKSNRFKNKNRRDRNKSSRRNRARKKAKNRNKRSGFKTNKAFKTKVSKPIDDIQVIDEESNSESDELEAGDENELETESDVIDDGDGDGDGGGGDEAESDSDSESSDEADLDRE